MAASGSKMLVRPASAPALSAPSREPKRSEPPAPTITRRSARRDSCGLTFPYATLSSASSEKSAELAASSSAVCFWTWTRSSTASAFIFFCRFVTTARATPAATSRASTGGTAGRASFSRAVAGLSGAGGGGKRAVGGGSGLDTAGAAPAGADGERSSARSKSDRSSASALSDERRERATARCSLSMVMAGWVCAALCCATGGAAPCSWKHTTERAERESMLSSADQGSDFRGRG